MWMARALRRHRLSTTALQAELHKNNNNNNNNDDTKPDDQLEVPDGRGERTRRFRHTATEPMQLVADITHRQIVAAGGRVGPLSKLSRTLSRGGATNKSGASSTNTGDSTGSSSCSSFDAEGRRKAKIGWARVFKVAKIIIPHVGLTALLLAYIVGGAAVFQWIESDTEMLRRREKLANVTRLYDAIINESLALCQGGDANRTEVRQRLSPVLGQLSWAHEWDDRFAPDDQLWALTIDTVRPRWTFAAAVCYALTVITTTGYDHVSPLTDQGRLFTVFFGLMGIPLMFITAADIGKFLSEIVTRAYGKLVVARRYARTRWHRWRRRADRKPKGKSFGKSAGGTDQVPAAANGDLVNGLRPDGSAPANGDADIDNDAQSSLDDDEPIELPIFAYFFLILAYCAMGSALFNTWERGEIWSFVHGFFFSFNTITTIGLGNILVRHAFYLMLIVVYVVVGLAVITMCVDLASGQLKVLFTKLHYFGRKFKGAKGAFMNMSDDIREAMKLIAALKRQRNKDGPGGGITLEDLKNFLEVQQRLVERPFVPKNVHFFRWIEEDDSSSQATMSHRSGSVCPSLKHTNSDPMLHI